MNSTSGKNAFTNEHKASAEYDDDGYQSQVVALCTERVQHLEGVIKTLESAHNLTTMLKSEIAKDTEDVRVFVSIWDAV